MASDRDSEGDDEFYETDDLSEIHQGIINDDLDLLRQALEAGVDSNKKFSVDINPQHEGMTPLALASALNKIEAVKILLTYRANVNDTFASLKTTALMTSSFHGHSEVVRILLKKGADVRAVDLQGSTALGYAFGGARTIDVISQLLKSGVDVNQKNMLGMSALLLVAGYGNDVLAKMILDAGADANAVNDFGHSALHLTVVGKRSQIKKLTSGQTGPYGLNRRNIDVALKEWARLHGDTLRGRDDEKELEKVGQFMMNIGSKLDERENINDDDNEAMKRRVEAVWRHRQDKMQGEKEKKKPGFVDNFLSCGGKRGKQAKQRSDSTKSPMARPLVPLDNDGGRSSVSPEVEREIGLISDGCSRILRMIIDSGCEIDKMEKTFGMTALDMAILLGDVESTAVLVGAGGDASHLVKMFALTDLYEAMVQVDKKQVRELLTYDTDLDVNQHFSQFNITRRRGATGEADNLKSDGLSPLTVAAQMSEVEVLDIIKMLQKQGANVNSVGPGGSCPIAEACRIGNLKMVQFLVSQGATVETKSPAYKDATPVVIAAMFRHRPVVEFLLSKEAKIDKPMTDGRSALLKAVENDDRSMVETLLNANLLDNFSDRGSFSHAMAETYQRPDRDFESLMRTMIDEARHLAEREREENARQQQQGKMPRVQLPITTATAGMPKQSQRRQTPLDEPPRNHQGAPGSRGGSIRGPEVMVVHDNDVHRHRQQRQQRPPSPAQSSQEEEEEDDEEDGLERKIPTVQQKAQKKQQKQQQKQLNQPPRQPPPPRPAPPPAQSSGEEEESEEESEEEEEEKVPVQPVKQQQQQRKQQEQPPVNVIHKQQPPKPPPPAESSSGEEEDEEEEEQPVRQAPQQLKQQPEQLKQQPQPQKQQKQQQQPKKEEQLRKPLPPERSSSGEEDDDDEEEEEEVAIKPPQQQAQQRQPPQPLQKQPQQPLQNAARQPPQATKQPMQPNQTTKQPESEEDEEEESEEEESEEEDEEPPRVVSAQPQRQQQPPPQAAAPPQGNSKAPSRPPPGQQPPPAKQNPPPASTEEEEEESEEEESEEEEEEEKPLPRQPPPPAKSSALPVILPSARLENRSFQILTKDPGPKSSPARPNNVAGRPTGTETVPSRAVPAPALSPMSPLGPPPPLPSTLPPSDGESESEEEWDEDGDFEEDHVAAGARDGIALSSKAGPGRSTAVAKTTNVTKTQGGVVTRTVVTKTVVTSGVVKTSEPAKGRVNMAKEEDSDDDDDDDDEEEEEEEEESEDERGQLHRSTETDI